MNRLVTTKLLIAAIWGSLPFLAAASGMRLVSQDGLATARGEAFVATADNPSAVYYNPAGITQLTGNNLRGGIYGIYLDPTYQPPAGAPNSGNTYHIENQYAAAPQMFYAYTPEKLPVSFGLGLYAPYGGGLTWPQDTGFRTVATESSLFYVRFDPVVAIEVLPGLSLGAGATINYAKIDLEQGLRANEQPFANSFAFSGDGWSFGYNVGILWQPLEKLSFGGTFRSATPVNFEGHTDIEQQPIIQPTELPAHAEFKFPFTAVVGVSYRPTPKWNLEFNADYTDWSSFGTVIIYQTEPAPFPVQQDIAVNLNWQPSWIYEFGVTRYFDNGWHLSAGYLFNENSVPDATYAPSVADLDRQFITVGVGRKGTRFDFDLTYQFGFAQSHTVTGSVPPSQPASFAGQTADGTYDFVSHAVLITVGMHF